MSAEHIPNKPDVAELMQKIRSKVRAEVLANKDSLLKFKPKKIDFEEESAVKSGDLQLSEDLLFLNRNYILSGIIKPESFVTHRKGLIGKLIVKFKRKLSSLIIESILKDYVSHQQEFFAHLVRHLNQSARYMDARDGDLFWQMIHKIDTDVGKACERIERIRDEVLGTLQSLEKNGNRSIQESVGQINLILGQALATQDQHAGALKTLDSVVRGLEGLMAQLGSQTLSNAGNSEPGVHKEIPDFSYVLLENRFRGSELEIRLRQEMYAQYFQSAKKPVLDVGCGRGELLNLFREKGITAKGIDLDPAMIEQCRAKNLEVEYSDLLSYLRQTENDSLGGLIALQVVEHLPHEVLKEFVNLAKRKVCVGGLIIFETINPTSMTALSSNYFRDPTHVFPQHPDTLGFILTLSGLALLETKYLAEVPVESQLKELSLDVYMTPRWSEMIELFNHNIKQLNSMLFGFQDYCVIARVPER